MTNHTREIHMKTVGTEPRRDSRTCGYQLSTNGWDSRASFCAEPKARGLYYCQVHHEWVAADTEDGVIRMAPGNVKGR
ncbi:hypothetical protein ACNYS0_21030 [Streptomyces sp. BH034]|uniref:hypothetical protein n=1 Tax=Streptomyces sp. BH034 TaxID=3402626 RepID=UPI003BB6162A